MTSRLMLGCGSIARRIALELREQPGKLRVGVAEESLVERLRSDNIPAERVDVTDASAVASLATSPASVLVFSDDPVENCQIAQTARDVFPEAFLLCYTGERPTPDQRETLASLADETLDAGQAVAGNLLTRVGEAGVRVRQLRRTLRQIDGTLAVVAHDNPDPDAIASAVALKRLAETAGTPAEAVYFGDITHQENRAMVNLLDLDIRNLEDPAAVEEYGGFALVDHSRPGVNDQLPPDTEIDIVIDHHPPRAPVEARFVDLRSGVGATSTLLVDHIDHLGMTPREDIATGLLYGIRVDTDDFRREVASEDFEAAAFLLSYADTAALERVETPSVGAETFETIARAIANRRVQGSVVLTGVGSISDRDALAQAADRLLDMEGITTTLVYGIKEDTVYASARARGTDLDLGEIMREAYDQIGSAGGHADMAGAQISLGLLGTVEAEEDRDALADVVREVMDDRFLDALRSGHRTMPFPEGEYHGDPTLEPGPDGE